MPTRMKPRRTGRKAPERSVDSPSSPPKSKKRSPKGRGSQKKKSTEKETASQTPGKEPNIRSTVFREASSAPEPFSVNPDFQYAVPRFPPIAIPEEGDVPLHMPWKVGKATPPGHVKKIRTKKDIAAWKALMAMSESDDDYSTVVAKGPNGFDLTVLDCTSCQTSLVDTALVSFIEMFVHRRGSHPTANVIRAKVLHSSFASAMLGHSNEDPTKRGYDGTAYENWWSPDMVDGNERKLNLFHFDRIFMPVNLYDPSKQYDVQVEQGHWYLLVIFVREKTVEVFDPHRFEYAIPEYEALLKAAFNLIYDQAMAWMQTRDTKRLGIPLGCWSVNEPEFPIDAWKLCHGREGLPQQDNSNDCGMFVVLFARAITEGKSLLSITKAYVTEARKEFKWILLRMVEAYKKVEDKFHYKGTALYDIDPSARHTDASAATKRDVDGGTASQAQSAAATATITEATVTIDRVEPTPTTAAATVTIPKVEPTPTVPSTGQIHYPFEVPHIEVRVFSPSMVEEAANGKLKSYTRVARSVWTKIMAFFERDEFKDESQRVVGASLKDPPWAQEWMGKRSVKTLFPGKWLTDEAINYLLADWIPTYQPPPKRNIFFVRTSFVTRLLNLDGEGSKYGYDFTGTSHKRAVTALLQGDLLFFPCNIEHYHWYVITVDEREKTINLYDSMATKGRAGDHQAMAMRGLFCWVGETIRQTTAAAEPAITLSFEPTSWKLLKWSGHELQKNGEDCGVFCVGYAYALYADLTPMHVTQKFVTALRSNLLEHVMNRVLEARDVVTLTQRATEYVGQEQAEDYLREVAKKATGEVKFDPSGSQQRPPSGMVTAKGIVEIGSAAYLEALTIMAVENMEKRDGQSETETTLIQRAVEHVGEEKAQQYLMEIARRVTGSVQAYPGGEEGRPSGMVTAEGVVEIGSPAYDSALAIMSVENDPKPTQTHVTECEVAPNSPTKADTWLTLPEVVKNMVGEEAPTKTMLQKIAALVQGDVNGNGKPSGITTSKGVVEIDSPAYYEAIRVMKAQEAVTALDTREAVDALNALKTTTDSTIDLRSSPVKATEGAMGDATLKPSTETTKAQMQTEVDNAAISGSGTPVISESGTPAMDPETPLLDAGTTTESTKTDGVKATILASDKTATSLNTAATETGNVVAAEATGEVRASNVASPVDAGVVKPTEEGMDTETQESPRAKRARLRSESAEKATATTTEPTKTDGVKATILATDRTTTSLNTADAETGNVVIGEATGEVRASNVASASDAGADKPQEEGMDTETQESPRAKRARLRSESAEKAAKLPTTDLTPEVRLAKAKAKGRAKGKAQAEASQSEDDDVRFGSDSEKTANTGSDRPAASVPVEVVVAQASVPAVSEGTKSKGKAVDTVAHLSPSSEQESPRARRARMRTENAENAAQIKTAATRADGKLTPAKAKAQGRAKGRAQAEASESEDDVALFDSDSEEDTVGEARRNLFGSESESDEVAAPVTRGQKRKLPLRKDDTDQSPAAALDAEIKALEMLIEEGSLKGDQLQEKYWDLYYAKHERATGYQRKSPPKRYTTKEAQQEQAAKTRRNRQKTPEEKAAATAKRTEAARRQAMYDYFLSDQKEPNSLIVDDPDLPLTLDQLLQQHFPDQPPPTAAEKKQYKEKLKALDTRERKTWEQMDEDVKEYATLSYVERHMDAANLDNDTRRYFPNSIQGQKLVDGRLVTDKNLMSMAYAKAVWEKPFIDVLKKYPGQRFKVPVGEATEKVAPAMFFVPKFKLRYFQADDPDCAFLCMANAMDYLGFTDCGQELADCAHRFRHSDAQQQVGDLRGVMAEQVPKIGMPKIFNQRTSNRARHDMSVESLVHDLTPFPTFVIPRGVDGSVNHAFAVVDDLIFDSTQRWAMMLSHEVIHWICGEEGVEDIHLALRFCERLGTKVKFDRPVQRTWSK